MAMLAQITCAQCGQQSHVSYMNQTPLICHTCSNKIYEDKRTASLTALAQLTVEERLALIEQWIYEHKQVQHGYIHPPRF